MTAPDTNTRPMRPTEFLRFVERTAPGINYEMRMGGPPIPKRIIRVLQQAWAPLHGGGRLEWRDVPCVKEGDEA